MSQRPAGRRRQARLRTLTLARADAISVLLASATRVASIARTASAGFIQIRSTTLPSPSSSTPGSSAGLRLDPVERVVQVGCLAGHQALDGDVARLVVQRRQQPAHRRQRVRDEAAPHPRVHRVVERLELDDAVDQAPQRRRQCRSADVPVDRVGDHDHVAAQQLLVLVEQCRQGRRTDLLLALDEHRHADGEIIAEGTDRGQVRGDTRLVVGRTAREQAAVALGRLERLGVPVGAFAGRLDVVVRVEQDRRGADGCWSCARSQTAGHPER